MEEMGKLLLAWINDKTDSHKQTHLLLYYKNTINTTRWLLVGAGI